VTTIDYSDANTNGAVARMRCATVTNCNVNVTLPATTITNYALRMSALYVDGTVDITASSASGTPIDLKNAQIQVDATGKAQDVLRRVQVRLPMNRSGKTPDYAIQSGSSICKRFSVTTNYFNIPNDIEGQDLKNPMCRTMTAP